VTIAIPTASQTLGPFWHALARSELADLTRHGATGRRIELHGAIVDGAGHLVTDACVELWQPTPALPRFDGWGRSATDTDGRYAFVTLAPEGFAGEAAYVSLIVLARGLQRPLWTRCYFADDATDPLLGALGPARRATMIATREGGGDRWRFDIRLQGPGETVFLDV
jgi:protocatechuate 3,4-dioxygenase, alpha subunit